MQSSSLLVFFFLFACAFASSSFLEDEKRDSRIENSDFDMDDLQEGLKVYRNMALSRLVKKAAEAARYIPNLPAEGMLASRSGSRTPELSALWKTRVG